MKDKRKMPEIILRNGKPAAVILDLEEHWEMLERLEDKEDLEALEEMGKRPLQFRKLEVLLERRAERALKRLPE
jgi:PHD/YefM family antitoxin component YafN of YafNO toxin-antitoxin module